MAIDGKLQLELIPYVSPTFPTHRFTPDVLEHHFHRVLDVVAAYPRSYVLFCGAVFDKLLAASGIERSRADFSFHLPTTTGTSKSAYRFSRVTLEHDGSLITAGIARSFATQGLPMPAYAARCRELYDTAGQTATLETAG